MSNKETPEAKTRRELIDPALKDAGWEEPPHSVTPEETVTAGRVIPLGQKATRKDGLRADYILRYNRDFKLAVVEAKKEGVPAGDGLQQAKDYAEMLGVKFAYATNGIDIILSRQRIVACLASLQAKVEAVKRHQAATAARLEALLPSILDRAFGGKL